MADYQENMAQSIVKNQMCGNIVAFHDTNAQVKISKTGQVINWPIKDLPEDAKEGAEVFLKISTNGNLEEERIAVARKILEELVN